AGVEDRFLVDLAVDQDLGAVGEAVALNQQVLALPRDAADGRDGDPVDAHAGGELRGVAGRVGGRRVDEAAAHTGGRREDEGEVEGGVAAAVGGHLAGAERQGQGAEGVAAVSGRLADGGEEELERVGGVGGAVEGALHGGGEAGGGDGAEGR